MCRACGVSKSNYEILDAFGGFGIDALALAHFSTVEVVERDPLTFVALAELASRFRVPLTAVNGDALARIGSGSHYDVIYLDPMFPRRSKKALPNRAMQYLQLRNEENQEAYDLVALVGEACDAASDRVVLKRRIKDPVVGLPNYSLAGRTIRFDVYR